MSWADKEPKNCLSAGKKYKLAWEIIITVELGDEMVNPKVISLLMPEADILDGWVASWL